MMMSKVSTKCLQVISTSSWLAADLPSPSRSYSLLAVNLALCKVRNVLLIPKVAGWTDSGSVAGSYGANATHEGTDWLIRLVGGPRPYSKTLQLAAMSLSFGPSLRLL